LVATLISVVASVTEVGSVEQLSTTVQTLAGVTGNDPGVHTRFCRIE
jgi:hypothetical protein